MRGREEMVTRAGRWRVGEGMLARGSSSARRRVREGMVARESHSGRRRRVREGMVARGNISVRRRACMGIVARPGRRRGNIQYNMRGEEGKRTEEGGCHDIARA